MKLESLSIGSRVVVTTLTPHPLGAPVTGTVREVNIDAEGNALPGYEGKLIGIELDEHFPAAHCLTPTEEKDSRGKVKRDAQGNALGLVPAGTGWYSRPELLVAA